VDYRLYKPEDFEALYALEEACFQPPFRFGRTYMRDLVKQENAAIWIAEDEGGAMAGFAVVLWDKAQGGVMAYLETLEVRPDLRGKGTGGELLRRCEESARAAGLKRWNCTWMRRMGRRLGFIVHTDSSCKGVRRGTIRRGARRKCL